MTATLPHVVVLHRWRAPYAHYHRYLDHRTHHVSYITTDTGRPGVPAEAAAVMTVTATDDLREVSAACSALVERLGPPVTVVALKEDDLLIAAELNETLDLPGRRRSDLLPFRDKATMIARVAAAGVATPTSGTVSCCEDIATFAHQHGWPIIVKPRSGSSSAGVRLLNGEAELSEELFDGETSLVVQTYNPHPIYHVDGVFDGTRLAPWRAYRYIGTPLQFRQGRAAGSVEEDRPDVLEAIQTCTAASMAALTDQPTVFHLELFVDSRAGVGPQCEFLEVGARVGGAETAFLWREVHHYDLMEAAFRIALGQQPPALSDAASSVQRPVRRFGGMLLVPAPASRPCRISTITSMLASDGSGPYAESLLSPGDVLPDADAYYEHVGGRFRFAGPSSAEVERAILATARNFVVTGEPLVHR